MRVGCKRQDLLLKIVFNGLVGRPAGGPVGIQYLLCAIRRFECLTVADDTIPELGEISFQLVYIWLYHLP